MRLCYIGLIVFICSCNSFKDEAMVRICLDPPEFTKVSEFSWDDVPNLPKMHGDWIKIEGYFSYNFEDVAVYSSRHVRTAHAISIDFKYEIELQNDKLQKLAGKKVVVFGRLDPNGRHQLDFPAMIDSAYCIEEVQ